MMKESQVAQVDYLEKIVVFNKDLDPEWVELMKEAMKQGLKIEDIRNFLRKGTYI